MGIISISGQQIHSYHHTHDVTDVKLEVKDGRRVNGTWK
jgi:hypothetical protein